MNKLLLRRRFIVDWTLQGSLVCHGLLYGVLVLVVFCVGIFAPLLWNLDGGQGARFDELSIVMIYLHERFWPLALLSAVVVVAGAIRFSHRIAGPMVRFKRNLRLLAEGRLTPPLRTRSGDYLQEEVACLNRAVAGVRERMEAARAAHTELERRLRAAFEGEGATAVPPGELLQAVEAVRRQLDGFEEFDPGDDALQPAGAGAAPRPVLAGRFE